MNARQWLLFHSVIRLATQGAGVILLFLGFFWYRFPAPAPYFLGFIEVFPAFVMLIGWALLGFGGVRNWEQNAAFMLPYIALIGWSFVSIGWARFPTPALSAGLQSLVVGAVVLAFSTAAPGPGVIAAGLAIALAFNSVIAILQAATQAPIGLAALGEYTIRDGGKYSTLSVGSLTYLRPYGMTTHPNLLGGCLCLALIVTIGYLFRRGGHNQRLAILSGAVASVAIILGWAALLLSFSRAAWLGFAVGSGALALLLLRVRRPIRWRAPILIGVACLIVGGIFFIAYRPFVMSRTGLGDESGEQRSIADRALFLGYTYRMIASSPFFGVGNGMNDWESAQYVLTDPLKPDLAALPVHNVPLLILSEVGVIGFALWLASLAGALYILVSYLRAGGGDPLVLALFAAFAGLTTTSFFDFYMWRQFPVVLMWYGILGAALCATTHQRDQFQKQRLGAATPATLRRAPPG
jgi:O-antigen ligase